MKNEREFTKLSFRRKIGAIKISGTILILPMQVSLCLQKIGGRLLGKLTMQVTFGDPYCTNLPIWPNLSDFAVLIITSNNKLLLYSFGAT